MDLIKLIRNKPKEPINVDHPKKIKRTLLKKTDSLFDYSLYEFSYNI